MKRITALSVMALTFLFAAAIAANDTANRYAVIKLEGSVNPIISEFLVDSIRKADREGVQFIVLQLDTPGGLITSMRDIIKAILTSNVPVVVFAFPKGAQAASAGGYIMLAAHIAVMAPGTEIGAMHPVSPGLDFMTKDEKGQPGGIMEKKVLNDTIAYAKSLAEKRRRNVQWAVDAVKDAKSSSYEEALKLGVIDLVAEDMRDLLVKLNNRTVDVNGRIVTLHTVNITEYPITMDWKQEILNRFADPQIVLILLVIAIVGIGIEIKNPGLIVPGAVGGISLILFLLAIKVIPINIIGLLLIVLAVALFVLELKFTSYGVLTIGGIASFVIGSMILIDSPLPGGRIPTATIVGTVLFVLGFVFVVVRAVLNVHKSQVTTGVEGLIGEIGVPLRGFTGSGKIKVRGEIWNAECSEPVADGEKVTVEEVHGLTLIVKKKS